MIKPLLIATIVTIIGLLIVVMIAFRPIRMDTDGAIKVAKPVPSLDATLTAITIELERYAGQ